MFKLLIVTSLYLSYALANPTGAPIQDGDGNNLCVSLTPAQVNHGDPQEGDAPYTIGFMDGVSTYSAGTPVQVTVSGMTETDTFRGVLCQARADGETTALGTFTESSDNLQLKECVQMGDTITHVNADREDFTSLTFMWDPPMGEMAEIEITCTVVQSQRMFWVGIPSSPLTWMNDTMMAEGEPSTAAMPDGQDPMNMETTTAAANSLVAGSFFSLLICMLLAKTV